ncbi:hypothetical protein BGZ74_001713 [Mortierella antarctica]|nr:hypothetical protein BGZ74_001713 [Mortierella antarctica]
MRESPLTIDIPTAHSLPSHITKGGLATPLTALPGYFNLDKDAGYHFVKNEKDLPQPQPQPQQQQNQPQQQLPSPAPSPVMCDYFFNGANKELNNNSTKRMNEYEYPSPVKGESPYQSYLTHPFTMQRQQKRQQELMRAQSITHRAQPQRSSLYLNNKYNNYVNSSQNQHVHLICASTKKTSVNSNNNISATTPTTPTGTSPRSIASSVYADMPTTTSALSMIEQEKRMSVGSIDYYAREGRQEFYQAVHVFGQGHSIRSDDLADSTNSRRQSMTPSLTSPPPPPYLSSDHGVAFHNHNYIDHKSSPSESSISGPMRSQSPTTPLPTGMTTPGHRGSVQGWPSAMAMSLATATPVTRPKQARTLPLHVLTISSSSPNAIHSPMSASGIYHPNKIFTPVTPDTVATPGFTPRASRLMDRGDTDTLYSFQLSDAEGGSALSAKERGPQSRVMGHVKSGSIALGSAAQAAAEANSATAAPYFPGFWEDARQSRLHWMTFTAGCALVVSTAWIVAMPAVLAATSFGIVGVPLAMLLLLSVQFSTHRWRRYRHRKLNSKKRSAVAVHAHAAAAAALMPSSPSSSTRTNRSHWSPRPSSLISVTSLNEPLPASVHQSSPKIRPTPFLEPHQPSGSQDHQRSFQPRLSQQMLLKHQRELNEQQQQVTDSGIQIERSRTISQQESSSSSLYAASVGSSPSASLPSDMADISLSAERSYESAPAPLRLQIPSAVYHAQKKEAVELPDLGIGSLVGDLMAEFAMDINGIH